MATKALHKFTVAESNNLLVYENYSAEQITCQTSYIEGTNWITSGDGPAKKVTIIPLSGHTNDDIKLYLKIKGSYGDAISLEANDYPITIDKLLIDQIKLSSGDDTDDTDKFSVISFH